MTRLLGAALATTLLCSGCAGFRGPAFTLDAEGPHALQDRSYSLKGIDASTPGQAKAATVDAGLAGQFELAYQKADADQRSITANDPSGDKGAVTEQSSTDFKNMARMGVALVDANCMDFFASAGANQKWLGVAKDVVALVGTTATGALAIASPANGSVTAAVALFTGTAYGGVDLYTRNFLFNADNIDSVRGLTFKALDADTRSVFPSDDTSRWSFSNAIQVVTQHQHLCTVASIRGAVQLAIKSGDITAASPADPKAAATQAANKAGKQAAALAKEVRPDASPGATEAAIAVASSTALATPADAASPGAKVQIMASALASLRSAGEPSAAAQAKAAIIAGTIAPAVQAAATSIDPPPSRASSLQINGQPLKP